MGGGEQEAMPEACPCGAVALRPSVPTHAVASECNLAGPMPRGTWPTLPSGPVAIGPVGIVGTDPTILLFHACALVESPRDSHHL